MDMKKAWVSAVLVLVAGAALARVTLGQELPPGPMPAPTASVNVGPAVAAKAANPAPSPTA